MQLRPTLLCVDDESNVLEVLSRTFSRQFRVLTAGSGPEALEILRRERVDLLLTDQKMPDMTGIELARRARQEGIDVLTILLTAYTNPADLIAAINEGQVYRYVTKPWDVHDLTITVRNALEMVSLRREKERLLETLRKRLEALSVLYEVSRQAGRDAWTLESIVDRLCTAVHRVLPHDASAVLIETGEDRRVSLRIRRYAPLSEPALLHLKESVLTSHRKIAGVVLPEERVITHVTGQPSVEGQPGLAALPSSLNVPLVSRGDLVGTLAIFSANPEEYSPEDGELLDLLVNQTTDAISHVRAAERDARLRIEQMVDTMADGVVLADEAGEVVVVNAAARAMLELESDGERLTLDAVQARTGLSPFELVRGWEYGARKAILEELKLGERSVQVAISPVVNGQHSLRGVLMVLHDVTRERQLEERKDEFVSIVSHELRTPLTSISGALELVLANMAGEVNDKQRRFLDMARESTERLNSLVDDLLDLSKFAQGRMGMNFEFVHLDALVRLANEKYEPAMAERQIEVTLDVPPGPVKVLADPNRIGQVMNNLLTNAVKFTGRGGKVRLSLRDSTEAPGFTALTVWNSGDPIDDAALERIFDRFEQARSAKNKSIPGTGLGLSICRNIVEAHGGRIWAEPCGDGARFVVVLPVEPKEPPAAVQPPSTVPTEPKGTVLVVEDQPEVAWLMKAMLLDAGFKVVLASTGDEALTLARRYRPQVITLDQRLPDVEGLALLSTFTHDPDTRGARVLVVSAVDIRDEAMRAGAAGFVLKPLSRSQLVASVEGLLGGGVDARGRILVVDDDTQISAICAEVLANKGFLVRQAASVAQARAMVREFRPDLLLLDVMLPDGDGFGFFTELKAERASGLMSIIFLSARGDTPAKVRALNLGAEDYLTKPFDALELAARVETVVRRKSVESMASPTTQLPGSGAIEQDLKRRLDARQPFAFCYLDLDNLKAYNDYYGFAKADGVVKQTGDLLRETFAMLGGPDDFVGHVAGDDFVFMTSPERVDAICQSLIESFDRLIPLYYDRADRERGFIEADDRFGERRRFPIMSVSIAAVLSDGTAPHGELARVAAELKKRAKSIQGSVVLRSDRDAKSGALAEGA